MESSTCTPALNDDRSGDLSDPDMWYKIDLQRLLTKKMKSLMVDLEHKHAMLTSNLNIEWSKSKALEQDHVTFKASCKTLANQEVASL
jgi:hypothetical protein